MEKIEFPSFIGEINNFSMPGNCIHILMSTENISCEQLDTADALNTKLKFYKTVENGQKQRKLFKLLNIHKKNGIVITPLNGNDKVSNLLRLRHNFDCVSTRPANTKRCCVMFIYYTCSGVFGYCIYFSISFCISSFACFVAGFWFTLGRPSQLLFEMSFQNAVRKCRNAWRSYSMRN